MTTGILRAIDRWRFETPLAILLAIAAAFFAIAVPAPLIAKLPVIGGFGIAGRAAVALLAAAIAGGVGYAAMRRTTSAPRSRPVVRPAEAPAADERSAQPTDRLARFRRADTHPDAPPRSPIFASRDLGEPFMEVGAFAPPPSLDTPEPETDVDEPEAAIPDDDFAEPTSAERELLAEEIAPDEIDEPFAEEIELPVETAAEPAEALPIEAIEQPVAETAEAIEHDEPTIASEEVVAPSPVAEPATPAMPPERTGIDAMMSRLSAGLERRAGARSAAPAVARRRDMAPALRDALNELNRLAARGR